VLDNATSGVDGAGGGILEEGTPEVVDAGGGELDESTSEAAGEEAVEDVLFEMGVTDENGQT